MADSEDRCIFNNMSVDTQSRKDKKSTDELLPGELLSSFEFDKLDALLERTESFGRDDGVDELIEDWKKP